jgi:beta-N-acetylhexosaminidase
MTELRNSFGDHVIVGISGTSLSDEDKELLAEVRPLGILLLARNFASGLPYEIWLETYKELLDSVYQYAERDEMLITIDHEGGTFVRTPAPITRFPLAALYRERAEAVARATATELRSLGVNVSWAPVTDIHSNPHNPIIGPRALGCEPNVTAQYATAYLKGLEAEGVLGSAKHFPGHGDTLTDSHLELPVLSLTKTEIEQRELVPFKAMVNAGVSLVMTAHIMFPQIDPNAPATLSKTILTDILRKDLGYEGAVVSDDVDMEAVATLFDSASTLVDSFNAGCDLFIISRYKYTSSARTLVLAQHFNNALKDGLLSEDVVVKSRQRINHVVARTTRHFVEPLPKELFVKHAELGCEVALG